MAIAPIPNFEERSPTVYERKTGTGDSGRRGSLRFQEGILTDVDVSHDFGVGRAQGGSHPGRPNHNVKVDTKYAEETTRERSHVGSASWIDAPPFLSEFSQGAFSDHGTVRYEEVTRDGSRQQRVAPTVVTG